MKLIFLGAAGTVTGSKYLLESAEHRWLVDCGLFQGDKSLRSLNWDRLSVDPTSINGVFLTHAHLDHSGYLPLLVRSGFRGPIYCSSSTVELCQILLPDSGFLQEKDAEFANRHGYSKHKPALPLYTEKDARETLKFLKALSFDEAHSVADRLSITLRRTGHILGASSVELRVNDRRIIFSGDLGRYDDPMLPAPVPVEHADYLVVESTYGDRQHDPLDPGSALQEIVARTTARGGTVIVPAFAVGRAQSLMFYLQRLKEAGQLRNVPIFLDSPMAIDASDIYCRNADDHLLSESECKKTCAVARYVRTTEESKALTASPVPKIIISASGMATGGRVLHHLKHYAADPRSTVLLAGFQAPGTRGAAMVAGARSIKIHGDDIPVRAEVRHLSMLSAHADGGEIVRWLKNFKHPPKTTFITHGEPPAAEALKLKIEAELGWTCRLPRHLQTAEL